MDRAKLEMLIDAEAYAKYGKMAIERVTDPDGTIREQLVDVNKRKEHMRQVQQAEQSVRAFKLFAALRKIHTPDNSWTESDLFSLAASMAAFMPEASQFELLSKLLSKTNLTGGLGDSLRDFLGE